MPGRYESNPAEVVAGFVVYPKNEYVVEIQEPKGSEYSTKDGPKAGIRANFRIADGDFKGKTVSYFGDELNDFGKAANKRLVMAALGYDTKEESEKKFNTEVVAAHSWGFNSNGDVDDGWLLMKGKAIYVELDVNAATDGSGKQYQKFVSFRPYSAPPATAS